MHANGALGEYNDIPVDGRTTPVAARSKAWVCGRSLAGTVGSNTAGGIEVCLLCCALSGSGFRVWLITRPEETY
jgi:hypothetical protein